MINFTVSPKFSAINVDEAKPLYRGYYNRFSFELTEQHATDYADLTSHTVEFLPGKPSFLSFVVEIDQNNKTTVRESAPGRPEIRNRDKLQKLVNFINETPIYSQTKEGLLKAFKAWGKEIGITL